MDKLVKKNPLKITFVCSGNICRSAYAEFAFKKMIENSDILRDRMIVDSGGLSFRNTSIDPRTMKVLKEEGIDEQISTKHVPRYKEDYPEMLEKTDLIIGMTNSHKLSTPKRWRKGDEAKFIQISQFAINEKIDVEDPYWTKDYAEYKAILMKIKEYLIKIKEKFEDFYSEK